MVAEEQNPKASSSSLQDKEEAKEEKKETPQDNPKPKQEKKTSSAKTAEDKEEIEIPKNLEKLVKEIEELKVTDLAALVKVLEKKFGVSAAPAAVAVAPAAAGAAPEEEEKKMFNVLLTGVGDKKIEVIKAVRDITQRGLKESKDLVDKAGESAQILKENAKKEEAEEMKKKLEEAGATVELK